jgi:hypothetical protein
MSDQFAAWGIHFNGTGLLEELTGIADGASTNPDGWCPNGGRGVGIFPPSIAIPAKELTCLRLAPSMATRSSRLP